LKAPTGVRAAETMTTLLMGISLEPERRIQTGGGVYAETRAPFLHMPHDRAFVTRPGAEIAPNTPGWRLRLASAILHCRKGSAGLRF
jgi:hypothetical protein